MILYCDTSALVKLYIAETASDVIRAAAESASALAVSRIAWVEAVAAFARRARETPADASAIERAREGLARDWPRYLVIELTQPLVELAAEYADTFALRAYDSVQLASAQRLNERARGEIGFACFGTRLSNAARALGMIPVR